MDSWARDRTVAETEDDDDEEYALTGDDAISSCCVADDRQRLNFRLEKGSCSSFFFFVQPCQKSQPKSQWEGEKIQDSAVNVL